MKSPSVNPLLSVISQSDGVDIPGHLVACWLTTVDKKTAVMDLSTEIAAQPMGDSAAGTEYFVKTEESVQNRRKCVL